MFSRSSREMRTWRGLLPSGGPTICRSSIISMMRAALLYPIRNLRWSMDTDNPNATDPDANEPADFRQTTVTTKTDYAHKE